MGYTPYESPEKWLMEFEKKDGHMPEKNWNFCIKINLTLTNAEIFPVSFKIWTITIQAFQMRHITFLYLKGVKR